MRKHLFSVVILGLTLAASTFGLTMPARAEEPDSAQGGTFVYARRASTTSLDLFTEITSNNAFAIDKIFEPLVLFDADGNINDWLAASHRISDDGLTYTFVLQDGLKFSDGTPVTAGDVVFSLEHHLKVGGSLPIEASVASITAEDDQTVIITLDEAYTPFLSELANFSNGIVPADFGGKTEEEFFKNPIGTGPFMVSAWDPSGDLSFVRNPYYWQEGKPYLDGLTYKVVDDDNQLLNQLLAGEVDGVEDLSYSAAQTIDASDDTALVLSTSWNVEEIFFNTLDEHFSDVHVRRALALVLDREAITQAMTFGYAEPAWTVLPAALRYQTNDSITALNNNLEKAREELAASAYPDGFDTTISVNGGSSSRVLEAQIVQAAAAQIGIHIEIDAKEIAAFRSDFKNLNYAIMINSATADYPDANSIMAFQVDPEGFSQCYWTSYTNETAVKLMRDGQTEPDGDGRAAIYEDLQQILADEVPYIPLYYPELLSGIRSNVAGFVLSPNGSVHFEDVYFTED